MPGNKRFVGGWIPLELFELLEAVRGERGIGSRTDALAEAIALWVSVDPPKGEFHAALKNVMDTTMKVRAARTAFDDAVAEWRMSRSAELLKRIIEMADVAGFEVPESIMKEIADADLNSEK